MGDLWIQMLTRDDRDLRALRAAIEPTETLEDVVGFEAMVRRDPSNTHLHDDAAVLYLRLGRAAQAAVHFEATATLKPDSSAAHFNLGTVLTMMGRLDASAAEYRRALELKPEYALWQGGGSVAGGGSEYLPRFNQLAQRLNLEPIRER
jgi:Flp pilus assembly protein TadD